MKFLYLDFEFNGVSEARLNLVSCAIICTENGVEKYRRIYWLLDQRNHNDLNAFLINRQKDGYIFVAFVMEAEARSIHTLMPDFEFQAIDLYLEYRCLLNHNYELAYGKQYIDGTIKVTKPPLPKWERDEEDAESEDLHHKPQYSLAAALYKMLDVQIDTKEKDEVRDLIIAGNSTHLWANMTRIMNYNMSDVEYLQRLLNAMYKKFRCPLDVWIKAATKRGEYSVLTAKMIALGYPINADKVKRFTCNIKGILKEATKDCLEHLDAFRLDKRTQNYVMNQNVVRDWVVAQGHKHWRKTTTGKISISKDAFNDWYDSRSEGFAGAFCRYLKTKQSLNGFMPGSKRGKFTDFVGSDNRVRPFFGIYGSQSSRSQPGATGFIPLKAHWMRNFIEARKGYALCGIDYSSQEFLIAGVMSQDKAMMEAYESGDVYLAFAKTAGLAPKEATKSTHSKIRNICKELVLGISYDMSAAGLSPRLTKAAGELVTESQSQNYIDLFYDTYSNYAEWKAEILREYKSEGCLKLVDGWTMWGDNPNHRSVGNFPIQGTGAVIMREAVRLSTKAGLRVIYTLHDALYIEYESQRLDKVKLLMEKMKEAFVNVMSQYGNVIQIRVEGECWSKDYTTPPDEKIDNVNFMPEYVDDKGKADLERYRKFFTEPNSTKELHNGV